MTGADGVCVVGDLMLDRWIDAVFKKQSPEAEVPVARVRSIRSGLGGAGNTFFHTFRFMEGAATLVGLVGMDSAGDEILKLIQDFGTCDQIVQSSRFFTVQKDRYSLDGHPIMRIDRELEMANVYEESVKVYQNAYRRIQTSSCVLFSDYAKGTLTEESILMLISDAKARGVSTISDPPLGRLHLYAGTDLIKPNQVEWNTYVSGFRNEKEALSKLWNAGTKYVLITMGREGMRLTTPSFTRSASDPEAHPLDVTGAGDVVAAAAASVVARGRDLEEYFDILLKVGSAAVAYSGTNPENPNFWSALDG